MYEPALVVLQLKEKIRMYFPVRNIAVEDRKDDDNPCNGPTGTTPSYPCVISGVLAHPSGSRTRSTKREDTSDLFLELLRLFLYSCDSYLQPTP